MPGAPNSPWPAVLAAAAVAGGLGHVVNGWWPAAFTADLAGAAVVVGITRHSFRRAFAGQEARLRLAELEREWREERAHDARSAATAIHGAAQTIADASDQLDPEARTRLARALESEARRLLRLIEPAEPECPAALPFDVRRRVEAVVACRTAAGFDVSVEIPDGLHALGDPGDTTDVLANLLDNARRHAPGSPVLVRAGMELGNAVVRVEDRGPGVEPSEWAAIFERGRRGSRAAAGGHGLGLYVSRRLMRRQGGDLWVEGRPGGGASFVFYLPGFLLSEPSPTVGAERPEEAKA